MRSTITRNPTALKISGFKRYIGDRGIIIHKKGSKLSMALIGENILDCVAYARLSNLKDNYIAIATHGSISRDMIASIKALLSIYSIGATNISLLFDNDQAGKEFTKQVINYIGGTSHLPLLKDFFDYYIYHYS